MFTLQGILKGLGVARRWRPHNFQAAHMQDACVYTQNSLLSLWCVDKHCNWAHCTSLLMTHVFDTLQLQQCLHLSLQSVGNMVAEYDLLSGCKLGSTEAGGTPISLQYTSEAALLVAVLKVCHGTQPHVTEDF